jgi:rhamnogalacturonyl hydrolase YesR
MTEMTEMNQSVVDAAINDDRALDQAEMLALRDMRRAEKDRDVIKKIEIGKIVVKIVKVMGSERYRAVITTWEGNGKFFTNRDGDSVAQVEDDARSWIAANIK